MAIYGCTVEVNGASAEVKGQRGLSSVTRVGVGIYVVAVDPIVSLAMDEFSVSCTLCNFSGPVPMGGVVYPLPIKQLVNQNQLFVLTVVDNMLVDCSFDLIVEPYRS